MSKIFSSILFSFFLLLQNTAIAEENETNDTQKEVIQKEQEAEEVEAPEEELSEAQKEAIAAEEAELREVGMEQEPPAE